MREILIRTGLIAISGLFVLCAAEFSLRSFAVQNREYYLFEPGLRHVLHPDSLLLQGVSGAAVFQVNRLGLRGDPPQQDLPTLLIVGGSVVECTYLDQQESWPMLLQKNLRNAGVGIQVFAAGKSGHTGREHCAWIRAVPEDLKPRSVLLLSGLNDFLFVLARNHPGALKINPQILDSIGRNAFVQSVRPSGKGLRSTALYARWKSWRLSLNTVVKGNAALLDDKGSAYARWRKHRAACRNFSDTLPDLRQALHDYRNNLNTQISFWQKRGARVYVAEVATAWRDHNTLTEEAKFWMGGIGRYQLQPGCTYYTTAALARGIALFNTAGMEVARKNSAVWIPASESIKSSGMYYDDCHLNEAGAAQMADDIFSYMK